MKLEEDFRQWTRMSVVRIELKNNSGNNFKLIHGPQHYLRAHQINSGHWHFPAGDFESLCCKI